MRQVRIDVDADTYALLEVFAQEDYRLPTGQAAWMLREAVRQRQAERKALRYLEGAEPGGSREEGPA
jgi:hypothetical protein